jgi:hypothetical protein
VDYSSGNDPIASIAAWIAEGAYGNGTTVTWTGEGITSTTAEANSSTYGIGYADAADPGDPAGLAPGQIEIIYPSRRRQSGRESQRHGFQPDGHELQQKRDDLGPGGF